MSNTVIGKVAATEKRPTTIDEFFFWTSQNLILNPFDVIKVRHIKGSPQNKYYILRTKGCSV
jgi:hypothetical protein